MSWIKNIFLVVTLSLITLLACNFLTSIYLSVYKESRSWILEEATLEILQKYKNQLNHLREIVMEETHPHAYGVKENIIFNRLSETNTSYSVLITGDSWGEKFAIDFESYRTLKNYSHDNKIDIILSGTTSYSPTLLGIQARILNKDFHLNFDEAYVVIDNTDIGDELCRYRNFIGVDSNGDKIVHSFDKSKQTYNIEDVIYTSKVFNSDDYSLIKFAKLALKKINNIITTFTYNSDETKCGWNEISKYLYNISKDEEEYFAASVDYLIESLTDVNPGIVINLITVPHKKHITKEYSNSVAILLNKILENRAYENVNHTDFSGKVVDLINSGFQLDDIYVKDDLASHLTSFAHNKMLVPFILSSIKKEQKR
jgi:hypothetical protein